VRKAFSDPCSGVVIWRRFTTTRLSYGAHSFRPSGWATLHSCQNFQSSDCQRLRPAFRSSDDRSFGSFNISGHRHGAYGPHAKCASHFSRLTEERGIRSEGGRRARAKSRPVRACSEGQNANFRSAELERSVFRCSPTPRAARIRKYKSISLVLGNHGRATAGPRSCWRTEVPNWGIVDEQGPTSGG